MATPIPPDHWLAKLRWRLTGDPDEVVSTIAMRPQSPETRPPDEIAEAVFSAWLGAWEPTVLSNAWSFVGVDIIIGSDNDEHDVGTFNEIQQGVMTQGPPPQNCSMLLRKKTARAGRRNSGRMYLPAGYMAEEDVTATGAHATAALNSYMANATQFFDNLTDSTVPLDRPKTDVFPMLLHSEPVDGDGNVTGPAPVPTEITSLTIDPIIATQRQRLRR